MQDCINKLLSVDIYLASSLHRHVKYVAYKTNHERYRHTYILGLYLRQDYLQKFTTQDGGTKLIAFTGRGIRIVNR